mmetsp:Transcript_87420/g.187521  ORF Transcript_87420/g.187521 Transcript_87420/m.187521 type:complete len:305 (-) Transcript_87420:393-1307(-)
MVRAYWRAAPLRHTALSVNSRLSRRLWAQYLKASGSLAMQSRTNSLSSWSSCVAPFMADPRPFAQQLRTKSLLPRRSSLAPVRAVPLIMTASMTNSLSSQSSGAANLRTSPLYFTASRMRVWSVRRSSPAYCRASPPLVAMAVSMISLSSLISSGAIKSCFQSSMTTDLQLENRKLLEDTFDFIGSMVLPRGERPCFSAACVRPEMNAATPVTPGSSPLSFICSRRFSRTAVRVSCSSWERSFDMPKPLRIDEGSLSLTMSAAWAPVRNKRLGISMCWAASMRSKRMSFSTFMKLASNFSAPHS